MIISTVNKEIKRPVKDTINKNTNISRPILSKSKYNPKYSLMNTIHYGLQSHQIIPKSVSVEDFYKNFGFEMISDSKLDKTTLKQICRKIKISHEIENGKEHNLLDGLNLVKYVDGDYKEFINIGENKKIMIIIEEDNGFGPIFLNTKKGKQTLFNNLDAL